MCEIVARAESVCPAIRSFSLDGLEASRKEVVGELERAGVVVVAGVPELEERYWSLINVSRELVARPLDLERCRDPYDPLKGWARGADKTVWVNAGPDGPIVTRVADSCKGSYYAKVPDCPRNVWPGGLPSFRLAFTGLGAIVAGVLAKLLPLVGHTGETDYLGRLLHYQSAPDQDGGTNNSNWCETHRDGWLLTGLCADTFYSGGAECERPEGCGLYVEGTLVAIPRDAVVILTGAYLESLTNGAVVARDHRVSKAPPGYERYAFAVFSTYSDRVP